VAAPGVAFRRADPPLRMTTLLALRHGKGSGDALLAACRTLG
jgi:hypothetical protein